jgi:hypothetical protein
VEWSGVEWSGLEWTGVDWSGVEWSRVEWSGVEWSGVEWSGVEWSGVEWSGVGWGGVEWWMIAVCLVSGYAFRVDLEAGDILFVPKGMWHHVKTTGVCVMVTFWFDVEDDTFATGGRQFL